MKQLKFDIYIILCRYFITVVSRVLNLVKLTFRTAISSHQVMGISLNSMGHTEYGPFHASDWLEAK